MTLTLLADQYIPTQREEVKIQINQLLDDHMEPLVNSTIIDEIKSLSDAANVPTKFKDGVKFRKTTANHGQIINTWGTEEVPLARYFNYGTSLHWTESDKPGGTLAWPAQGGGGSKGRSIFFQSSEKKGGTIFSKGHYVSGVPRTEVMEIGFNIGTKRLIAEAGKLVKDEMK